LANGAGPPVTPAPLRKSAMIARVAIAPPMLALVNGFPLCRSPSRPSSGSGRQAICRR
jgi:hypothetical protein